MMKRTFALLLVFGIAQYGFAQITGSAHDFSGETWTVNTEICIVCHTPHSSNTTVGNAPLWNHEVTSTATFTLYTGGGTMDATTGQPGGSSKLCLSCHDGTVALENFGGTTTGTASVTTGDLGTDLSDDHPISFTYNTALATADGELYNPSTQDSGLGSTIDADLLFGGSLECGSCHDVHNAGFAYLLRIDNAGSALCLTCHNK
ncbi:MAG: cytochrome c3 family protein [Bacteroidota bacterium]